MEIKYLFEGKSVALITERVWKNDSKIREPGSKIREAQEIREGIQPQSALRFPTEKPTLRQPRVGKYGFRFPKRN